MGRSYGVGQYADLRGLRIFVGCEGTNLSWVVEDSSLDLET